MRTYLNSGGRLLVLVLALALGAWASPRKPKLLKFTGEVIRFDAASITVRSATSPLILHTFTYSPAVRGKMEKLLERGGYQYGDRVKIRYPADSAVALAISGKPSERGRGREKQK